jgi:hypothetical protein
MGTKILLFSISSSKNRNILGFHRLFLGFKDFRDSGGIIFKFVLMSQIVPKPMKISSWSIVLDEDVESERKDELFSSQATFIILFLKTNFSFPRFF